MSRIRKWKVHKNELLICGAKLETDGEEKSEDSDEL